MEYTFIVRTITARYEHDRSKTITDVILQVTGSDDYNTLGFVYEGDAPNPFRLGQRVRVTVEPLED